MAFTNGKYFAEDICKDIYKAILYSVTESILILVSSVSGNNCFPKTTKPQSRSSLLDTLLATWADWPQFDFALSNIQIYVIFYILIMILSDYSISPVLITWYPLSIHLYISSKGYGCIWHEKDTKVVLHIPYSRPLQNYGWSIVSYHY